MWWTSAKATPRAITCSRWPAASDQSPRWKCSFSRATSYRTASSIGTRYHARESRPVSSRRQPPPYSAALSADRGSRGRCRSLPRRWRGFRRLRLGGSGRRTRGSRGGLGRVAGRHGHGGTGHRLRLGRHWRRALHGRRWRFQLPPGRRLLRGPLLRGRGRGVARRELSQARLRLARVRAVGRLLDEALQHLALVRGVLEVPVRLPGAPQRVGADLAAAEVAVVVGEPDEAPCRALPRVPLPIEVRHVLLVLGQPLARFGDQLARARDVLAPRVAEHE